MRNNNSEKELFVIVAQKTKINLSIPSKSQQSKDMIYVPLSRILEPNAINCTNPENTSNHNNRSQNPSSRKIGQHDQTLQPCSWQNYKGCEQNKAFFHATFTPEILKAMFGNNFSKLSPSNIKNSTATK